MRHVVSEFVISKYTCLYLDGPIPMKPHDKYGIDGIEYDIVPMHVEYYNPGNGANRCIAIEAAGGFVGKEVEFILKSKECQKEE